MRIHVTPPNGPYEESTPIVLLRSRELDAHIFLHQYRWEMLAAPIIHLRLQGSCKDMYYDTQNMPIIPEK